MTDSSVRSETGDPRQRHQSIRLCHIACRRP